MSNSVLNKQICLRLNKSWVACGLLTVREAVVFLCSESNGEKPGFALDYDTVVTEDGERVLAYANPVAWDDWIKLPVRDQDLAINISPDPTTGKPRQIRAPLVVLCAKYNKVPTRTTRWSVGNVHKRDNYTCAYSGERLTHSTASVDHIVPRSRGGKDDWLNTVSCHKRINTFKADRTPEEAGLVLRTKPKAPPVLPVVLTKADAKHESQLPFLT